MGGWVFPAKKAAAGHIVPNTIYQPHLDAIRASGVFPFVRYDIRHTLPTRLGKSGVDPWTFQRIAGYRSADESKLYVRIADGDVEAGMDNLRARRLHLPLQNTMRRGRMKQS